MRIMGTICPKHPELEGWRIQYKSGSSICADCNVLRVLRWRLDHPEEYAKARKRLAKKQKTPTAREARNERLRLKRVQERLAADKRKGV